MLSNDSNSFTEQAEDWNQQYSSQEFNSISLDHGTVNTTELVSTSLQKVTPPFSNPDSRRDLFTPFRHQLQEIFDQHEGSLNSQYSNLEMQEKVPETYTPLANNNDSSRSSTRIESPLKLFRGSFDEKTRDFLSYSTKQIEKENQPDLMLVPRKHSGKSYISSEKTDEGYDTILNRKTLSSGNGETFMLKNRNSVIRLDASLDESRRPTNFPICETNSEISSFSNTNRDFSCLSISNNNRTLSFNSIDSKKIKDLLDKTKASEYRISKEALITALKGLGYLDFEAVKECNLSGKRLQGLEGLSEIMPHLEALNIDETEVISLTDAPPNLHHLFARNNKFDSLTHFAHLKSLQFLDLSYNSFENLGALPTLESLQELKLDHNKIERLDGLQRMGSLRCLGLSFNKIKSIDFENIDLSCLMTLQLKSNKLRLLKGIDRLKNLQTLNIQDNELESIEVNSFMPRLLVLKASRNKLINIDLENLAKLQTLFIDENNIVSVKNIDKCSDLTSFSIRNQHKFLAALPKALPSALRYVYASGNPRLSITQLEVSHVISLELSSCSLESLPAQFSRTFPLLKYLDVSDNAFESLRSFTGMRHLQVLILKNNKLSSYSGMTKVLKSLRHLLRIDLRGNKISNFYPNVPDNEQIKPKSGSEKAITIDNSWQEQVESYMKYLPEALADRYAKYKKLICDACPTVKVLDGLKLQQLV